MTTHSIWPLRRTVPPAEVHSVDRLPGKQPSYRYGYTLSCGHYVVRRQPWRDRCHCEACFVEQRRSA